MSQTLICVPIVSAAPSIDAQVHAAQAAGADLVELRVDLIGDVAAVEAFLATPPPLPVILTVRGRDEGGAWLGDESERIALIERLGLARPGFIDIELATWRRSANLRQKVGLVAERRKQADSDRAATCARVKNRLIVSAHDFGATPGALGRIFDALLETPAEVVKGAFAAADATDALRVLVELERCSPQRATIALAMGEAGLASRVLARKFGALLTFATVDSGAESAPGQPTVDTLRILYRWNAIRGTTRVFGVVGWPVQHSLSPHLHNAAMAREKIDGVYLPLPVRPTRESFGDFMAVVVAHPQLDLAGLSITVPHKEHALEWVLSHGGLATPLALRCGAVNTLSRDASGQWTGDNTDVYGIRAALERHAPFASGGLRDKRVLVLGAGGAARAAIMALLEAGADVSVANRTPSRAETLASELNVTAIEWTDRTAYASDLIVNGTSLGMWPEVSQSPMPADSLTPSTVVFDTVYRPRTTRLLCDARRANCATIDGAEMFLHQAAAQFGRWHDCAAPLETMRTVLDEALTA